MSVRIAFLRDVFFERLEANWKKGSHSAVRVCVRVCVCVCACHVCICTVLLCIILHAPRTVFSPGLAVRRAHFSGSAAVKCARSTEKFLPCFFFTFRKHFRCFSALQKNSSQTMSRPVPVSSRGQ